MELGAGESLLSRLWKEASWPQVRPSSCTGVWDASLLIGGAALVPRISWYTWCLSTQTLSTQG